jgi:predicted nuclease with TOPRIM domain
MTQEKEEDNAHIPSLNTKKSPHMDTTADTVEIASKLSQKTEKQFKKISLHLDEQDTKLEALKNCDTDLRSDITTVDTKLNDRIVFVDNEFYKIHTKTKELAAIIEVNRKERREDIEKTFNIQKEGLKDFKEDVLTIIKANTVSTRWTIPIMFSLILGVVIVALYGVYNNYQMIIHHTGYFALILNI